MRRRRRIVAAALSADLLDIRVPFVRTALLAGLATAAFLATPTVIAQQDAASLVLKSLDPSSRWAMTLAAGPGGLTELTTHAMGEVARPGAALTVGSAGEQVMIEGFDPGAPEVATSPDEERIDRTWKGDLPGTFTTPATIRGFSAGAIYREESRLRPPDPKAMPQVAFTSMNAPLSALAVARFISPRPATTDVADLDPVPLPQPRKDATLLVAANYPARALAPAASSAAEEVLAAYAPDASIVDQSMFDALFVVPKERPPVPEARIAPGDFWWGRFALPASAYTEKEQRCLAEAVYFEARGESERGQLAVAQVVLNRVKNPAYPDTICAVVYQNKGLRDACQFSFACDGIRDVVRPGPAWTRARKVARDITFGGAWIDEVGTSTHYHATYVRPNWAGIFRKTQKIGRHVFYQTRFGGWS